MLTFELAEKIFVSKRKIIELIDKMDGSFSNREWKRILKNELRLESKE